MHPVERSRLEQYAEAYDRAVERDAAIDPFCSRSAWILSYHDAFEPGCPLWMGHEGDAWVLLVEKRDTAIGHSLRPLESIWGFASPLVGEAAAELLARSLTQPGLPLGLVGLPLEPRRLRPLLQAFAGRRIGQYPRTTRYVASLEDGIEGWLARRSAAFRRNLRAARRRVREAGIRFRGPYRPSTTTLDEDFERVLACERRSWKSIAGNGAAQGAMGRFYAGLWPRLTARSELIALFAEREGETLGYLHGGLVRGRFRGLQMSFDDRFRRLGLGNILQFEMLQWLCEQGAHAYDLGSYSDYKRRWAEEGLTTFGLYLPAPVSSPI